jgi:hypothetical protein
MISFFYLTLPRTGPRLITITLDSIFVIKWAMIIIIVFISLFLLISIFNIHLIIGSYDLHLNIIYPSFDNIINQLKEYATQIAAFATAIGIIVTFLALYIERHLKKRDDLFESFEYDYSYLSSMFNEIQSLKADMKRKGKIKESNYEIYDFIFPMEVYEKMSLEKLGQSVIATSNIILDFYHLIKRRNKMYIHRTEVKHRFIRTTNDQGWKTFLEYFDQQISVTEEDIQRMFKTILPVLGTEAQVKKERLRFEKRFFIIRFFVELTNKLKKINDSKSVN